MEINLSHQHYFGYDERVSIKVNERRHDKKIFEVEATSKKENTHDKK